MIIYSANEVLSIGLNLVGVDNATQRRRKRETNVASFRSDFGPDPVVIATLWETLQTTHIVEAKIDPHSCSMEMFLMTFNFLKVYPNEKSQANQFKRCRNTLRRWRWYFVEKIAALQPTVIFWPPEWTVANPRLFTHVPTILITVDGVHFRANEPTHGEYSKNPQYYSHKFSTSAFNYEIAIDAYKSRVVHIAGPFPASKHDITIFRKEGLKEKIPDGKLCIGDKGYRGEPDKLMTPNSHDEPTVRNFKGRARARHESFNKKMKLFGIMEKTFIHGEALHKKCFGCIAVVCQFQMNMGEPLFDV